MWGCVNERLVVLGASGLDLTGVESAGDDEDSRIAPLGNPVIFRYLCSG